MTTASSRFPVVAIVGRPNVGKSSILNAVAGRRISIVDPTPGTTRDRVAIRARHEGVRFEIVDTGGITDPAGSPIDAAVRKQVDRALEKADVVVFLCDARDALTPVDEEIALMLRRTGRPVVLGVNKIDSARHEAALGEFYRLGFGDPVGTSAVQKIGISTLLDRVVAALPEELRIVSRDSAALPPMKLAIVGRQNAGKSTLVNALAGEERVIVSEVPGTTRDSVDVAFTWKGKDFIAIDTAGLRKKGRIVEPIEYYSRMRTLASLQRADVVLFLIDAAMRVSEVDKKIAADIDEQAKPCVIGINKYDLAEELGRGGAEAPGPDEYGRYIRKTLPMLSYAPISLMSALRRKNIFQTVSVSLDLYHQAHERIPTARLNDVVEKAKQWPGPRSRHRGKAKILYATQVSTAPPRIVLFVNDPDLFPPDYRRNLANKFRSEMLYPEIPIRLDFAKRGRGRTGKKPDAPIAVEGSKDESAPE